MSIPIFEAKNRLSALISEVERGHEIIITRHGLPVARLVPANRDFDGQRARSAAQQLREASRGIILGGVSIKDLVSEGRSYDR